MAVNTWPEAPLQAMATGKLAAAGQGLGAILLWAALASLTAMAGPVPPFQLAAMTFSIGTLVGLGYATVTGQSLGLLRRVPPGAWGLGIYGLLAYHVCFFFAVQNAPPVEANLINYLWPLLIVLFSGLLAGRHGGQGLTWRHLAGALLGFSGTGLILTGAAGAPQWTGTLPGYVLAFAAALIWSSYSVLNRLYADVPSIAVIGSCAATAAGALVLHVLFEATRWPDGPAAWAAVLGLGLGPVGLAFYLWDTGVKRG